MALGCSTKDFIMAEAISADTRRRISQHIANLGSLEENVAQKAESRLLHFGKKAVGQLIAVVSSDKPQVRFRAIYLLGKSGDPDALPVILRFIDDPDEAVRYDAVMALGYLGDQLNWQELKTEFEWDGSLCDLYILDTDVEIWQRMLDVLRASGYPLHYTIDHEQIDLPTDVGVIFNKRLEGSPMLSIEVHGININCHFVT